MAVDLIVYGFAIALIDAAVLPWLVSRHVDVSQPPPAYSLCCWPGGWA